MQNSLLSVKALTAAVVVGAIVTGGLATYLIATSGKSEPTAIAASQSPVADKTPAADWSGSEHASGVPGVTGSGGDPANDEPGSSSTPGVSGVDDDAEHSESSAAPGVSGVLPDRATIAPPESPRHVVFHPGVTGVVLFLPYGEESEGEEALPGVTDAQEVVEKVKVPDVEKLTLAQARKAFDDAGLECLVPNGFARDEDRVVRQSIHAGRLVDAGTEIRLDPIVAVVPDVTGLTVAAAIDLLNDEEGFDVGYGRAVTTENIVTHQKPKAGTFLPRGLPVTVICTVRVPNVQGQGVRDGSDQIGDAGLVAEFSVPADSSNFVFAQNPRAGSTVEVGAVVTLVPGITAPNLINMGYNAAQQTLVASSIRGQVDAVLTQQVAVTGPIATTREPWIIWQRPQPGAPMAKSDVLHVKVGRLQGVVVNPLPVGPAQPAAGAVCPECRKPHGQCTCNRGGGGFGG